MTWDGLKITLSGINPGLTVDVNGRALLPTPLILQCPPLEQYTIAHTFNQGTYDTIDDDQFMRRGSRQLDTWTFDTLAMYMGNDANGNYTPDWVPFPKHEEMLYTTERIQKYQGRTITDNSTSAKCQRAGCGHWHEYHTKTIGKVTTACTRCSCQAFIAPKTYVEDLVTTASRRVQQGWQMYRPEWYAMQLRSLFYAGAPFRYVAEFLNSTTLHRAFAVITAFNEDYKHGEGDSIYFSGLSFMEWRDPSGVTAPPPRFPAHIKFKSQAVTGGVRFIAYDISNGQNIKTQSKTKGTTFCDLARSFYGNASLWRTIAKANKCNGGDGNLPIFTRWYVSQRDSHGNPTPTLTIPAKPK